MPLEKYAWGYTKKSVELLYRFYNLDFRSIDLIHTKPIKSNYALFLSLIRDEALVPASLEEKLQVKIQKPHLDKILKEYEPKLISKKPDLIARLVILDRPRMEELVRQSEIYVCSEFGKLQVQHFMKLKEDLYNKKICKTMTLLQLNKIEDISKLWETHSKKYNGLIAKNFDTPEWDYGWMKAVIDNLPLEIAQKFDGTAIRKLQVLMAISPTIQDKTVSEEFAREIKMDYETINQVWDSILDEIFKVQEEKDNMYKILHVDGLLKGYYHLKIFNLIQEIT